MSNEVVINHKNANELVLNPQAMQSIQTFAEAMAGGAVTVPKHLQGKPADCLAVTMQAVQWGMNPFSVAQKTHLVSGNLGYEAQLVNAVIMNSGAIEGRFHYQYGGGWPSGNDAWVMCGAILHGEKEIQWGEPLYPTTVTTKNSPLWKTNPKQQAAYLAVKYWARMYCPGAILGVYSVDELEQGPERDVTPAKEGDDVVDLIMGEVEVAPKVNTFDELSDLIDDLDDIAMIKGMSGDIKADYDKGVIDGDQANDLLGKLNAKREVLKKSAIDSFDFQE